METGQEKPVSMMGGRWASPGAQGMGLPPGGIRAGSTRGEQYWDQTRGEIKERWERKGRCGGRHCRSSGWEAGRCWCSTWPYHAFEV